MPRKATHTPDPIAQELGRRGGLKSSSRFKTPEEKSIYFKELRRKRTVQQLAEKIIRNFKPRKRK